MKHLIILILFVFIGISNAQLKGLAVGDGTIWTDSLGYSASEAADSVWLLRTDFNYEIYRIFIDGNANSSVDTIYVKAGTIRYNRSTAVDTLYGLSLPLKNNAWTDVSLIVNSSTDKDFTLYAPVTQFLRFSLENYRDALLTRNVTITVQGIKRK